MLLQAAERVVPGERFELPTNGLQNRCSTTELTRQASENLRNFLFSWGRRTKFATILLPNVLWTLVYGGAQCIVNAGGSVFLHPGKHVAVKIERDPNLTVA
jgi:hypothetical protein